METATQYQITQEDIDYLNQKYSQTYKYPLITFTVSAILLTTTRFLRIPKFFRNPLETPEGNEIFYSRLSRMAKTPLLLYITCLGAGAGLLQYELAKYQMYVKYKTLVNMYLDSCEAMFLNELKMTQERT